MIYLPSCSAPTPVRVRGPELDPGGGGAGSWPKNGGGCRPALAALSAYSRAVKRRFLSHRTGSAPATYHCVPGPALRRGSRSPLVTSLGLPRRAEPTSPCPGGARGPRRPSPRPPRPLAYRAACRRVRWPLLTTCPRPGDCQHVLDRIIRTVWSRSRSVPARSRRTAASSPTQCALLPAAVSPAKRAQVRDPHDR